MTWILLHEGPDLFLTQWTPANKRPTHVRDVMCAAWACRSPRQVSIERRYASWAWYAIYWRSLGKTRLHTFRYNHTVNTSPFGRQPHIQRYFVTVGGYLRRLSAGSSVGGGHGDDGVIDDSLYGGNGGGRDMGIKSQIAWYLWQKGVIKIDEDFEVGDYFDAEDARRLLFHKDEKGLDSLDDIAYEVCL